MVDCHGSQCGFCTPGFVMSLFVLFKNYAKPNRNQILESLAGNLCRCTGYKPIIDAALQLHKYSKKDGFDAKKILKLLFQVLQNLSAENAASKDKTISQNF